MKLPLLRKTKTLITFNTNTVSWHTTLVFPVYLTNQRYIWGNWTCGSSIPAISTASWVTAETFWLQHVCFLNNWVKGLTSDAPCPPHAAYQKSQKWKISSYDSCISGRRLFVRSKSLGHGDFRSYAQTMRAVRSAALPQKKFKWTQLQQRIQTKCLPTIVANKQKLFTLFMVNPSH